MIWRLIYLWSPEKYSVLQSFLNFIYSYPHLPFTTQFLSFPSSWSNSPLFSPMPPRTKQGQKEAQKRILEERWIPQWRGMANKHYQILKKTGEKTKWERTLRFIRIGMNFLSRERRFASLAARKNMFWDSQVLPQTSNRDEAAVALFGSYNNFTKQKLSYILGHQIHWFLPRLHCLSHSSAHGQFYSFQGGKTPWVAP